jgi:ATP phosphoribosyltransferase
MIVKEVYGVSNLIDSNTELLIANNEQTSAQTSSSWLSQVTTITENIQKTLSFLNINIPPSLSTALHLTPAANSCSILPATSESASASASASSLLKNEY